MLCQSCQKRIANVHLTQMDGTGKIELYLCEQCARDREQINFGVPIGINHFLSGLMGIGYPAPGKTAAPQKLVCEQCGLSYEEFLKTGKFGCGNCYILFEDKLGPILKRLHGSVAHHGKVPAKVSESIAAGKEIERLKEQLNIAIQKEEYEEAAKIRDKIKSLGAEGKTEG